MPGFILANVGVWCCEMCMATCLCSRNCDCSGVCFFAWIWRELEAIVWVSLLDYIFLVTVVVILVLNTSRLAWGYFNRRRWIQDRLHVVGDAVQCSIIYMDMDTWWLEIRGRGIGDFYQGLGDEVFVHSVGISCWRLLVSCCNVQGLWFMCVAQIDMNL